MSLHDSANVAVSPIFPADYRASGLLLHVTSLPSAYGIGDFGPAARAWVDRLHDAKQTWWQILPIGPTDRGISPYQSTSSFAVNWNLVSPDDLIADGLLLAEEAAYPSASPSETELDYESVVGFKDRLLDIVRSNFAARASQELKLALEAFRKEHAAWLDDYALFTALHIQHGSESYLEWPMELVRRQPAALKQAERELAAEIEQVRLAQFLAYRQANRLREYAHTKSVQLIGDSPFYVSPNSSDVWASPELFLLDENFHPQFVGGVPPDYFSEDGQLWGNPIYNWDAMRESGYRWCIDRIKAVLAHVDLVRLDHFRGFAAAWCVPAEALTAQTGEWALGPGGEFFRAIQAELGTLPFIAEDLGIITPDVNALRDEFHLPGTRVLQFAFDGDEGNTYLPGNYVSNTVAFTATHDNNTTHGWYDDLSQDERKIVCSFLQRDTLTSEEATTELIRATWSSVAAVAIVPLQDLLNLPGTARMNVPGVAEGNWGWRCTNEMLASPAFAWLGELTTATQRAPDKTTGVLREKLSKQSPAKA